MTSILFLLVLVFLLIQVPFVQTYLTGQVERIAKNTLETDLGIGDFTLKFPSRVSIDEVFVNTPEGDTIARLDHLGVGLNMWSLIYSRVEINEVETDGVYVNIVTTDSTSNIQFLLDAFAPEGDIYPQESTEAVDSAAQSEGGWVIDLDNATLELADGDIYYQDDPAGVLADLTVERLGAAINSVDLDSMRFDVDYFDLESVNALVGLRESTIKKDTTPTEATAIELLAGRATVAESTFDLEMDSLAIRSRLPYVNLEGGALQLGEELRFNGELFQLENMAFALDMPADSLVGPGIDYNHLSLSQVEAEATNIAYIVDSLHLELRQLSAVERSGMRLLRTEGIVEYDPSYLGLRDFLLRTDHTELRSENTAVKYDFASANLEEMIARAQLDGYVGLRDVALLAPDLAQVPVVGSNLDQRVTFDLRANGTMANLQLDRIQLDGPGVRIRARGNANNLLDTERLGGRIYLQEFSLRPGPLLPLLADSLLPAGIKWPERIVAEGTADYRNDRLELDLYAIENRSFSNGLESRVKTSGVVDGVEAFPRTRLDLDLDTLLATRVTILAYVPPGTLPEDYKIPDFVRGSGSVTGPVDDLDVNLRLSLPGENTFARINGTVRNALEPDSLDLDLEVSDLAVNVTDLRAILPDSLLPSNLNLPDVRIRNARIAGSPEDLDFEVPLETDNGNWNLRGRYNPNDLDVTATVEGVQIPELFTGELRDTLATLELGPLDIRAEITGQLEPAMDLAVDAFIAETGGDSLLDLNALVSDDRYAADFTVLHPDFRASGEGAYELLPDSTANVEAVVDLERVDLQQWDITEVPLLLSGSLEARSEGIDPYDLEAYVRFDDVALRGEEGSSYIDSLAITASLQELENEIYLRSDVLDAELLGRFDPLKTPEKLAQFIVAYWDESLRQPNPVENGDRLDFALELKRPQPLIGGLINGLTELSPATMSLLYRDETPELLFNLDLAKVNFAGLEANGLELKAIGDTESMNFEADWNDIGYNDQVELGRTVIAGETVDDQLLVELKLFTEEDSLRHYLGAFVDQSGDTLTVSLDNEQILNFDVWAVPASNLVTLAGEDLTINNLSLRHEGQFLRAITTEPGDVEITFEDFNLRTPSRLIFSEQEMAAGVLNGTIGLDNVMTNLGIRSDLTVDNFSWTGQPVGDFSAQVTSGNEQDYNIDVTVDDKGNDVQLTGTYRLDGPMDLLLDVNRLPLTTIEPFSLNYLTESTGYLSGELDLTGTIEAPRIDGSLQFNEAELVVSLLGEQFRMGDNPIVFSGRRISFGEGLQVFDSEGGDARLTGDIALESLDDIELDLLLVAEDFVAINSTEDDNSDYYGRMSVDARVEIGGTATLPIVNVDATTNEGSDITYVYTLPEEGLVEDDGIVDFTEEYLWQVRTSRSDELADTLEGERTGLDLTLNLDVDPNLEVTVVVDPVTGQTFVGRADGDLTIRIFPDGRQEATGRVEVVAGTYDFIFQVLQREFEIIAGSSVLFTGQIDNPQLDLNIRHEVRTSPLPLVQAFNQNVDDAGTLRRRQTFYVVIGLDGNLQSSDLSTNVTYPENAYGNLGLTSVNDALAQLRQDDSRLTRTAFTLLAFQTFNIPLVESGAGGSPTDLVGTTINNALGGYLNNLANEYIGFVELDFGLDSYEDTDGSTNTNLRVSLRKTLFDDRVVVSVDGVAGSDADDAAGTGQTYLDNITAEYLISDDGTFRLKFFNDRDRDVLVGGNVLRYGGRITFGKDFGRIGWSRKKKDKEQ